MNIVVTGGAGFIGSHLCEYLLEKGHEVICVDNYFTGSKENIKHLLSHKSFREKEHDIINPLFFDESIDQIYNLACPASPIHYQINKIRTIKACTVGMVNMLGIAKAKKARILQASTSEVYGDPKIHPQPETYWGNVNCNGPRSCFSEDTEILTKEGWKLFKDLKKTDELLTLSQNQNLEYHRSGEMIKQKYSGEMIHFKNKKIDLLVTPDHNMYVRKRDKSYFEFVKASEKIQWHKSEMQKSGKWNGKEVKYFYFTKAKNAKSPFIEKINMDTWLEFFGYYITEGCVHVRKRKREIKGKTYDTKDFNILIAQDRKHEKEREKIKNCLKRTGFKFYESDDHQFRICNKHISEYLQKFGKAKEKYIPRELKQLSVRQLKILFEALMLGDGNKKNNTFYSSSLKLIGDFQEIVLKLGMSAGSINKDLRKENTVYACHILTNTKRDQLTPKYSKTIIEHYDGFVYCVNVTNHIIYVRRNFKQLFCGNCYDEGKRVAESLMMAYHWQNNIDTRIVRIFNTYGPRMAENDGRVVSNFIIQALKNEPLTVYGDGSQTRSFCYVSDLVEAMYRVMNLEKFYSPINLGNPHEFTVLELANKVKQLTKSESEIVFKPLPQDDPVKRKPDISLAKKMIGWEPKIKLDDGLKEAINYFKKIL